jgi:DNA-binding HxlR family transcriptional regulator
MSELPQKSRFCSHLCPMFQAAMDVLARPWNGLLMATLEEGGTLRFGELRERLETMGDRMLSARLKELEARGLVERQVAPGPPVRVSYALTELGRGFGEVQRAIGHWGERLTTAQNERGKPRGRTKRAGLRQRR